MQQSFLYGPNIDEPLEAYSVERSAYSYYHADGLGSIIALTDSSGTIQESYTYDAYGIPEIKNSSGTVTAKSEVQNPQFLFTAREYDSESGLYFYRSRYYSPRLGRFLGRDTEDGDDKNRFTYVENNPINFIDPWGELSILPGIGAPVPPRGGGGIDSPFPGPTTGGKSKDRVPSGLGEGGYVLDEAKDKAKGEEENKGQEEPVKPKPKKPERNPKQDTKLSKGEIERMKNKGIDIHAQKGKKGASQRDYYKDRQGNVNVKPKGGRGPGEPTGINIYEL